MPLRISTRLLKLQILALFAGMGLFTSCQPAPGPDEPPILRPTPMPTPGGPGRDPRDGDDDLA